MKFALMLSFKESVKPETIAQAVSRRAEWKPPEGVELLHEFWSPRGRPAVIQLVESDDVSAIGFSLMQWSDVFEVDVVPIEEGSVGQKKFESYLKGS